MERCNELSPFYKEKLKGVKLFNQVPLTTKGELIESQRAFPPFGKFTDYTKDIYQIYRTSGTANTPLMLSFTEPDVNLIAKIGAECFRHSGMGRIGNREIVINCLNLSLWAGGFLDSQAMMKTGVQVINFGTGNTSELLHLIFLFNKKLKVSLHCTPSYLPIIEKKLHDEFKLDLSSLKIFTLYLGAEGGIENNKFRNNLQKQWHCKVFNANYGMSEVCSIMASANEENILKYSNLFLKKYYVELLRDNGDLLPVSKCKPGDIGDMVITSLYKESQPLLRYHTCERVKIVNNSKQQISFEALGRSDSMIVFKGINIFPEQYRSILNLFQELTGVYKLRIHKQGSLVEKLTLVCELKRENESNTLQLKQRILSVIKSKFSVSPEISFENTLPREGNKARIIEYC